MRVERRDTAQEPRDLERCARLVPDPILPSADHDVTEIGYDVAISQLGHRASHRREELVGFHPRLCANSGADVVE